MNVRLLLVALLAGMALVSTAAEGDAAQRTVVGPDGKAHIVHDELGPVLMHRVFPPYKGIHIHSSELQRMQSPSRRR